ncbi:MAG: MFS transporter [Gemmataceae bacterium]
MTEINPAPAKSNKFALLMVFLVVFIDLLGFGIVLPLLPIYGDQYVSRVLPAGSSRVFHGIILGLLMSSFSMMQFLFAPAWGRYSDSVGRKPILLLGLLGSIIFYALFGFASSLPAESAPLALILLFAARIGAGICGATIGTAQAVIADSTSLENRSRGMALIGAAFGIGFTFGPLVGFGALTFFPEQAGATGYISAALSLFAFVIGLLKMPETRVPGGHSANRKIFDVPAFKAVLATPALGPIIFVFFLATVGFGAFESTLAMINQDVLKFGKTSNFLLFAYVGFTLSMANGVYRPLSRRLSVYFFLTAGILLMGSGVASLAGITWISRNNILSDFLIPLMMISLTISVVGFAFLTPSAQALISQRADPERQGEILGVNQSCSSLARIFGPIFGLTLYKVDSMAPFIFAGVLVLAMLPLVSRISKFKGV